MTALCLQPSGPNVRVKKTEEETTAFRSREATPCFVKHWTTGSGRGVGVGGEKLRPWREELGRFRLGSIMGPLC